MRSDSDGDDYESLAALLAVAFAAFAKHKTYTTTRFVVEHKDSRRLQQVAVHARDRRERGGKQPSLRVKRTRRVYPRLTYNFSSATVEMLWRGELVRVRRRAITIVGYFARTFAKKKRSVKSGFMVRVVNPILPVWFCYPKMHLIFGCRYDIIRDGLTALDTVSFEFACES